MTGNRGKLRMKEIVLFRKEHITSVFTTNLFLKPHFLWYLCTESKNSKRILAVSSEDLVVINVDKYPLSLWNWFLREVLKGLEHQDTEALKCDQQRLIVHFYYRVIWECQTQWKKWRPISWAFRGQQGLNKKLDRWSFILSSINNSSLIWYQSKICECNCCFV